MIFARTVDAERLLGTQFRDHSLHRVYLAVALGDVESRPSIPAWSPTGETAAAEARRTPNSESGPSRT